MEDRRLSELVDLAIRREIEAYEFYIDLGEKVADAAAKDALASLASDERRHREYLERYKAGDLGPDALRLTQVVDYKIAEHLERPDPGAGLDSKDVYLVAAHREHNSHAFYEGLAAAHEDGPVKEMLLRMASEELRHKERVEYLYSNTAFPQTSGG